MADKSPVMTLKPIGFVRNGVKETPVGQHGWWEKLISEIVVDSGLAEALDGLEEYSHIIIICWMDRVDSSDMSLKIHPRGRNDLPLTGLFATRTPNRPNPLSKTTVRLLRRRDNILTVEGLDVLDRTPVVDIKPYIPGYDSVDDAAAPEWAL